MQSMRTHTLIPVIINIHIYGRHGSLEPRKRAGRRQIIPQLLSSRLVAGKICVSVSQVDTTPRQRQASIRLRGGQVDVSPTIMRIHSVFLKRLSLKGKHDRTRIRNENLSHRTNQPKEKKHDAEETRTNPLPDNIYSHHSQLLSSSVFTLQFPPHVPIENRPILTSHSTVPRPTSR